MRLLIDENIPGCEKLSQFLNNEFINKTAYTWICNFGTLADVESEEETVYLTEDYVMAAKLERLGLCSVYIQRDPQSGFASGVSRIMTDPIEITEDYLWRIYDHYAGRPHVIGSDGVILLRERIAEDFDILRDCDTENAIAEYDGILKERDSWDAYIKTAYNFYDFG